MIPLDLEHVPVIQITPHYLLYQLQQPHTLQCKPDIRMPVRLMFVVTRVHKLLIHCYFWNMKIVIQKSHHQLMVMTLLNPALVLNWANTRPTYTIRTFLGTIFWSTLNTAFVAIPFFHARSTVIPPRTRAPRINPCDHCKGSAGKSVTVRVVSKVGTSIACNNAFYEYETMLVSRFEQQGDAD